jgi:hypothetical protein
VVVEGLQRERFSRLVGGLDTDDST